LLGQGQCGRKRIRQWGTSDLDRADDTGSHRGIAAAAAAAVVVVVVAVAVDIAGSRGCSSRNVKQERFLKRSEVGVSEAE